LSGFLFQKSFVKCPSLPVNGIFDDVIQRFARQAVRTRCKNFIIWPQKRACLVFIL